MEICMKKCVANEGKDIYQFLCDLGSGENGFELTAPENFQHFKSIIEKFKNDESENQKPGRVPQEIYWMYAQGVPVAMVKIRWQLTDHLLIKGGHIGYSVSPGHRGRGYGNRVLKEGLKILGEKGVRSVLVTANEDNLLSRKVIEFNGGVLKDIIDSHCRYWIDNN
ncbi:MAG: GNAT family N-acetyltransferase [Fusobacteriaceae bacterium]